MAARQAAAAQQAAQRRREQQLAHRAAAVAAAGSRCLPGSSLHSSAALLAAKSSVSRLQHLYMSGSTSLCKIYIRILCRAHRSQMRQQCDEAQRLLATVLNVSHPLALCVCRAAARGTCGRGRWWTAVSSCTPLAATGLYWLLHVGGLATCSVKLSGQPDQIDISLSQRRMSPLHLTFLVSFVGGVATLGGSTRATASTSWSTCRQGCGGKSVSTPTAGRIALRLCRCPRTVRRRHRPASTACHTARGVHRDRHNGRDSLAQASSAARCFGGMTANHWHCIHCHGSSRVCASGQ